MAFRWFSSSSLTVPKALTTIGITVALISHNFCTCNLKSWYLAIFSSSLTLMFWPPGTVMAMILHSFFSLSVTTISGLRCSISLSVWIAKSQSILYLPFPALALVDAGPICLHIQPQILCTRASALFFQVCRVSSCIGFHLGQNTNWQYGWLFQLFLCRATWAAHIRLSVSCFSSSAFSHCHLLWSSIPSASLRNWPCNAFSFHTVCLSFSRSYLLLPSIFVLSCNFPVAAFRSLSLLFAA